VVYADSPIAVQGTTDYAPIVQAIMAKSPDFVYEVTSLPPAVALAGALKQGGYKGLILNGVAYVPSELASNANTAAALDGTYVESLQPTPADPNNAAVKQMQADLKAIGKSDQFTTPSGTGYWAADLLIQGLQATADKGLEITGENLHQTLQAMQYKGTAGGPGDMTVKDSQVKYVACSMLMKINGTKYETIVPYECGRTLDVGAPAATATTAAATATTAKP
jgi:ABC-type branched-subunit amino acid transport system substrate-binding protein